MNDNNIELYNPRVLKLYQITFNRPTLEECNYNFTLSHGLERIGRPMINKPLKGIKEAYVLAVPPSVVRFTQNTMNWILELEPYILTSISRDIEYLDTIDEAQKIALEHEIHEAIQGRINAIKALNNAFGCEDKSGQLTIYIYENQLFFFFHFMDREKEVAWNPPMSAIEAVINTLNFDGAGKYRFSCKVEQRIKELIQQEKAAILAS